MNRPLSNVVDITPQAARRWTSLIQVLENGHIQQSRAGTSFKRLVLTDTDVRATVLRCFESKEQRSEITTRRDLVIVDEEKKLLLLTLWNEFDENEGRALANIVETGPMIFAMRVKVTTFNCLSLTTRAASGIMINPPVTEPLQMHRWYNENRQELEQLVHMEAYKNRNLLLPYPKDEDIISIATVTSSLNIFKTAWIKGKITLLRDERSLWYSACANCQKSLEADLTWIVTCPSCKMESEVYPMCRLPITINDNTGTIDATLSTPAAETFIPLSPVEIQKAEEHGTNVHEIIATSIQQHTIVAFIRWYEVTFRGQTETKFNVVTAYKSNDTFSTHVRALPEPPKDASKDHSTLSTSVKKQASQVAMREGLTKKAKVSST